MLEHCKKDFDHPAERALNRKLHTMRQQYDDLANFYRKISVRLQRNKMSELEDPQTPEQWQEAVNMAQFYLLFSEAQDYGIVKGGPAIDIDRCEQLIAQGKALGYVPPSDEEVVKQFLPAYELEHGKLQ